MSNGRCGTSRGSSATHRRGGLTGRHVEEYLASVKREALHGPGSGSAISASFSRWLVRRGHLAADITADLRAPRQPRAVPRGYRRDVVDRLLAVAPDARARLIVLLEVQEGLRACEVARIEVGDVDYGERTLLVHGKGSRERLLPLSAQTWEALEGYLAERAVRAGPLVRSYSEPWKGISAAHVQHLVQGWLRLVGVASGGGHGLRHTMASTLLRDAGADIRDVQLALGHSNLQSTSVYLPFSDARRLRRVMDGRWYGHSRGGPNGSIGAGAGRCQPRRRRRSTSSSRRPRRTTR
jgi:site-specific recombinase XerC